MRVYEFGRFRLDADARVLFRDDRRIALTPKAVDVLLTLVENHGATVGRQELFSKVWADAAVEEGTLSSHISLLRKTLGGQFIETIPKRGYRFAGTIEEKQAEARILLAVLPFENMSGNKKYDAFSDGLTEEMITQLGRLNPQRLGVIARTSSMTYKSTDKTIEQIGRELGVSHILEGSARRAGGRVRIAAQLIKVRDQTHVWADSYEGDLEDILALQSRVSTDVARQIQIRLLPLREPTQIVPDAYEAYLKGRYLWSRRSEQDLAMSIRCFQDAARSDPEYALAYAGIADVYLTLMDSGYMSTQDATAKARPMITRALQLDDSLAEAHVSLGHAALHDFDWLTADKELRRALELNPNSSGAHYYYSNYLASMGRLKAALPEAEEARRLDPVSPASYSNVASLLWLAGDYARTVEQAKIALDLNPNYGRSFEDIGRAYEQSGDLDAAIEIFQKAIAMEKQSAGSLASLGHAYGLAERTEEASRVLAQLEDATKTTFISAYNFALVHLGLRNFDAVFEWLDKAYDERSAALPFLRVNPRFASVRGDARYEQLLRRVGV